ncbi:hypothetical protein B0T19DRAFT_467854 [Cercophora scortea]|uniref:Uncharacterized protein n=1 Tax=Cercophora scortea TaxID=314031 RepID=A0AAE0M5N7_9PEZI|nr:hypothetical protein B0T19DRAFT_467854 [Cercophora scortea]
MDIKASMAELKSPKSEVKVTMRMVKRQDKIKVMARTFMSQGKAGAVLGPDLPPYEHVERENQDRINRVWLDREHQRQRRQVEDEHRLALRQLENRQRQESQLQDANYYREWYALGAEMWTAREEIEQRQLARKQEREREEIKHRHREQHIHLQDTEREFLLQKRLEQLNERHQLQQQRRYENHLEARRRLQEDQQAQLGLGPLPRVQVPVQEQAVPGHNPLGQV